MTLDIYYIDDIEYLLYIFNKYILTNIYTIQIKLFFRIANFQSLFYESKISLVDVSST